MLLPAPNTIITEISPSLFSELTLILGENDSWKLVAREFNNQFRIFNQRDITTIENHRDPSWRFLQHLASRCCTVGLLCKVLREMELHNILSILVEPEPVEIVQQPGSDDETKQIFRGRELRLECQAVGLPPPSYLWFHGNVELHDQTTGTLIINEFSEKFEGEYYCCAYQEINGRLFKVNSNSVNAELHPTPPVIIQQPEAEQVYEVGGSVTLCCVASGHPEPQYEWFKGNVQLTGEESNVLNIRNIEESHAGYYRCYVKNGTGTHWSNICKVSVVPAKDFIGSCRLRAKEKVALLIGNDTYCHLTPLNTPRKDVATIAGIMKDLGFKVIALHNLTLHEMRSALHTFCSLLTADSYAFFHYAGHGFEIQGKFMLPIDAPGPKSYLRCDSLCEQEVIQAINQKKPKLIFMLLDMCLKVPDKNENPGIHREMAETYVFEPLRNQIIQYATTSNLSAYERVKCENSIYVSHLKEHLGKDLPIRKILDIVKKASIAEKQIPSDSSNVVDEFYLTDVVEESDKTKKKYQKITTLPQIGPTVRFTNTGFEAGIRVEPHKECFLNTLDIILSGLQDWNVEIHLAVPPIQGESNSCQTVDPSGICTLRNPELQKSLGLDFTKLKNDDKDDNDLVITIHNLQRVKIPLLISLLLKYPATNEIFDTTLLELGHPLIAQAKMWYNPKDKSRRQETKCESQCDK